LDHVTYTIPRRGEDECTIFSYISDYWWNWNKL